MLESVYRNYPDKFEDACKAMFTSSSIAPSVWNGLSEDVKDELLRLGYKPDKSILRELGEFALNIAKDKAVDAINKLNLGAASLITEENKRTHQIGDFVRDADGYYMVVRPKSETEEGVLAVLNIKSAEWCFRLACRGMLFTPQSLSIDSGCHLEAGVCNRVDGRVNTRTILNPNRESGREEDLPVSIRRGLYCFPAFNFVRDIAGGAYIPAIEELYDIFISKDMLPKLNERLQECLSGTIPTDVDVLIWSSTDNRSNLAYGGEALALMLRPDKHIIVQSIPKNKEAIVLPFKRF